MRNLPNLGKLILLFLLCVSCSAKSAWSFDSALSNIAIVVLDFQTLQLESAYVTDQEPCSSENIPVSDEELESRASDIFNTAGKNWTRRVVVGDNGRETLAFDVSRVGDFAVLEIPPGDFGGFAVSHPCSGLVMYAGSIVWSGTGKQLYPDAPVLSDALRRKSRRVPLPRKVDVRIGPGVHGYAGVDKESGKAAWDSVQDLNLVQELTSAPYSVLVYLYPRTVGFFDPMNADWVILVHRGPTPDPYLTATPCPTPVPATPTAQLPVSPLPIPPTSTPQLPVSPLPTPQL